MRPLANGRPDAAVRSGYAAVRRSLELRHDGGSTLTHWEFYRRVSTDDLDDAEHFRTITERYERAKFARDGVRDEEATAVLERAKRLCNRETVRAHVGSADD
ncbi:DUF4129 domain-containing protein [Natrononativus amylolyticus]|uniref:DUF4129 domain-containing protein n=1 Tax=Natrononativus amylolyticus TaxID=2963434 RepID=UPI0020CBB303|nr:DUF4129 domain-containing protein [Natrononativus amylolyticus]